MKQLPPAPEILLQYSGLIIKNTTQKLVDVTMLESELISYDSESDSSTKIDGQNQLHRPFEKSLQKQKNSQNQNQIEENSIKIKNQFLKSQFRSFKISKFSKLKEDEEIQLKKDGIKLLQKEEIKDLIKYRISNSRDSIHKILTAEKLITRKNLSEKQQSLDAKEIIKDQNGNSSYYNLKDGTQQNLNNLINKSTKSFSTLPGIQKENRPQKMNNYKERISGVMSHSQFINLKEYYRVKEENKNSHLIKKIASSMINSSAQNKNNSSSPSGAILQNSVTEESSWLNEKQNQKPDEADAMINKLRERKEKIYRTGINHSNGESYLNTKREATMMISQNQKASQNNQMGVMIAFDYSGQILPTFKYDTIKMQSHYQDMEFFIGENDDFLVKKKERKGHVFRGAINLKLVDHQKFIPHPQYKYEPLVEKLGMIMKENTAYSLKKGVQLKPKEQIPTQNGQHNFNESEQTRQRINKAAFEFLYNDEIEANKVKYQDFIRFKKSANSVTSLHKNPSSRKKIHDQKEESILSKKSIAFRCIKGKQANQQDSNNKVYKSQNRKALQMLITSVQLKQHDFSIVKDQTDETQDAGNPTLNGVLKKNSLHNNSKSPSNKGNPLEKKKVRIA